MHAKQAQTAAVNRAPPCGRHVEAGAIVANQQMQLGFVLPQLDLDALGVSVADYVSERFLSHPETRSLQVGRSANARRIGDKFSGKS